MVLYDWSEVYYCSRLRQTPPYKVLQVSVLVSVFASVISLNFRDRIYRYRV